MTFSPCISRISRLAVLPCLLAAGPTRANVRHFAYSYESAALAAGRHELELSSTWGLGRPGGYDRLDQRAEYEIGVTDRLLTSVYLNWSSESIADPVSGNLVSAASFDGISSEWKYKLADASADSVGFAVYAELSLASAEATLETKLILDKTFGSLLAAYNFTVEPALTYPRGSFTVEDYAVENTLGCSADAGAGWHLGAEVFQPIDIVTDATHDAALMVGPVVNLTRGEFWITVASLVQLPALKRSIDLPGSRLVLDVHEHYAVRFLASLPL